jgi:NADPH:quinone reductase-like Zn-dependent oxidoreductase
VGTAAVQLAVAAGARVVATVRNTDHHEAVAALGAAAVSPDQAGAYGPYDLILELVGAPNLPADLDALATGGRISVIGISAGAAAQVHLGTLMAKRARIMGSTLRARHLEGKAAAARAVEAQVLPLFASGRLTVPLAATFPLEEAAAAYDRFAAGGKLGKIVLVMS